MVDDELLEFMAAVLTLVASRDSLEDNDSIKVILNKEINKTRLVLLQYFIP